MYTHRMEYYVVVKNKDRSYIDRYIDMIWNNL